MAARQIPQYTDAILGREIARLDNQPVGDLRDEDRREAYRYYSALCDERTRRETIRAARQSA